MRKRKLPPVRWLKVKEAADWLGVSKSTVRRIIMRMEQDATGKYGVVHTGRILRVREDGLIKFMQREEGADYPAERTATNEDRKKDF